MRKISPHNTPEELKQAARKAKNGRIGVRIQMILDVMSGQSGEKISKRHGCSRTTLYTWIDRYNKSGLPGLEDNPRSGARPKLEQEKVSAFKERILNQPDYEKDGIVRWRIKDIKKVLLEEFSASFKTEQGVHRFVKSLGLSSLTTRPSHPKKDEAAIEEFKKNCPKD